MSLVVPNVGDVLMLRYVVNNLNLDGSAPDSGSDRLLRLYSNNVTPNKNTILSDLTEVSGSTGYSAATISGLDFTIETNGGINSAEFNDYVTFNFSSTVTVYGFYVTTQDDELLWVERFDSTYSYPSGGELKVKPVINFN